MAKTLIKRQCGEFVFLSIFHDTNLAIFSSILSCSSHKQTWNNEYVWKTNNLFVTVVKYNRTTVNKCSILPEIECENKIIRICRVLIEIQNACPDFWSKTSISGLEFLSGIQSILEITCFQPSVLAPIRCNSSQHFTATDGEKNSGQWSQHRQEVVEMCFYRRQAILKG